MPDPTLDVGRTVAMLLYFAHEEQCAVRECASYQPDMGAADYGSRAADRAEMCRALASQLPALLSSRSDAERTLTAIRELCSVVYWPPEVGRYPIEHNMAAQKDQWGAIVAELTAATLEET